MIYLDNNATTRPAPEVIHAVMHAMECDWGNPSSSHGIGRGAAQLLTLARAQVARLLGVDPERLIFSSGATEANEAVLRHFLRRDARLVTSPAEHPALSGVYRAFAEGAIRTVSLDERGLWRLEELERALQNGPALVAVAQASGETGVLQDVNKIREITACYEGALLVDASQSIGRIRAPELEWADFVTFSSHKLHGPKGVGGLVVNGPDFGRPLVQIGGGQEGGARGGTENVPGIAGFGAACDLRRQGFEAHVSHLKFCQDRFEAMLLEAIEGVRVNGLGAPRVPGTSNIFFPGVDGMALVARLEERGVYCSQVSACSSGLPEPSKTLTAMGLSVDEAFCSVRFSVAYDTPLDNIDRAASIVCEEVAYLRKVMGCLS